MSCFFLIQFVVDRLDYQQASHDVYSRKAVGLVMLRSTSAVSAPTAMPPPASSVIDENSAVRVSVGGGDKGGKDHVEGRT